MTLPPMPPQSKHDVADLLAMVQTGHCSCRKAADLLFPQFMTGRIRQEEVEAYSYDETRVVEYLTSLSPDIGAGFDPIGFLIASHKYLAAERRQQQIAGLTEAAEIAGAFERGQQQMIDEEGLDEGLEASKGIAAYIKKAILRRTETLKGQ